ncbi:MAG: ABC transporter permease [Syntrophobacteraceae bacterium]|jgi:putative ABC transport system permease protein|nr:ABC transporter permease [Syntrophobacteraceae bacterium]
MLKLIDLFRISLRHVYRQKRRYLGVIVSIALGTAGLIAVIIMGRDVKANLNQDLDLLGRVTILKAYFEPYAGASDRGAGQRWFQPATVAALRRHPGVSGMSLAAVKPGVAVSTWRDKTESFVVIGVDGDFWELNGFEPAHGKFFTARDVARSRRTCVLGVELARRIFGRSQVAGQYLPIDNDIYLVTGTLGGEGASTRVDYAFVPLTTASQRMRGVWQPERLYVRCKGWDDVRPVAEAIPRLVKSHQPSEGLRVEANWEHLTRVRRIAWWVELFIYLSIAATLSLGGFGIWNGMMAAVQSRTREIGLKKAVGAEDRDILIQFLIEALCLSLGSAILGCGLGRLVIQILSLHLNSTVPEEVFLHHAGLALFFSVILGAAAGYYPALRASRMEVVSAIRYE